MQARMRRIQGRFETDSIFHGLYISDREVEEFLSTPRGAPRWAHARVEEGELQQSFHLMTQQLEERERESERQGVSLPLLRLQKRFQLSPFERDVILITLAPELEIRYEKIFAYLQDDLQLRRPGSGLLLDLVTFSLEEKLQALPHLSPAGGLLRHRLLVPLQEGRGEQKSPGEDLFRLDGRVVQFLLGSEELCEELAYAVTLHGAVSPADEEPEVTSAFSARPGERIVSLSAHVPGGVVLELWGPSRSGRRSTVLPLCREAGLALLVAEGEAFPREEELFRFLPLLQREALLQGAAIFWRRWDRMLENLSSPGRERLLQTLDRWDTPLFLSTDRQSLTGTEFPRRGGHSLEFALPSERERLQIWESLLEGRHRLSREELLLLSSSFRLTRGEIHGAIRSARAAASRNRMDPDYAALALACRRNSHRNLEKLASLASVSYGWEDIVLPDESMEQLREICNTFRYSPLVYGDWGFGEKLQYGKGLTVLFSGSSGTGKTMAAGIIAGEIGLDLFRVDLSLTVSKYIGETEKNLSRIFAEAESSHAVLFFDEADALFGKRSEVKDSHDRYANIETGYLLQRMEEYEGIVILATNLRNNMDEAFARRIAYAVSFPFPGEEERLRIWQRVWPAGVPLSDDLDFDFMARQFKVSGGNIKNIALAAAFLAADEPEPQVRMDHLVKATHREYQKLGKACVKSDFGPYYSIIAA